MRPQIRGHVVLLVCLLWSFSGRTVESWPGLAIDLPEIAFGNCMQLQSDWEFRWLQPRKLTEILVSCNRLLPITL